MLSIVVVDDEISTLNGIAHILHRYPEEFDVALEATSAMQALDLLERAGGRVDVVLTDVRMPVMNGMQLVEALSRRYPHIKTVVLSAHGDYDYVRACMKHGAVDYLLKPCRYQALLATLRRIGNEKHTRERERKQADARDRLRGVILSDDLAQAGDLPLKQAGIVCLRPRPEIANAIGRLQSYLNYTLPARADEAPHFFLLDMERDIVLLLDWQAVKGSAESFVFAMHRSLSEDSGISAMAYGTVPDGARLAERVRTCRKLCDFLAFNGIDRPVSLADRKALYARIIPSGFAGYWTHSRLLPLLQMKNRDEQDQAFSRLVSGFSWPEGLLNPAELKREGTKLLFSLEQNSSRQAFDADDLSDGYIEYSERINAAAQPDELLTILHDCVATLSDTLRLTRQHPRYIGDAIQFIKSHYMDNLLLSDVSQSVFLNEWYFSSQFKKHVGVSFKEYLNATRIEAAKRLLLENDLKIGHIAEMAGFGDATYFATSFKRSTGKTPMEYRRTARPGDGN